MEEGIMPVLEGKKVLVVGVANDQSIAYGCAKAFHAEGAELAITWLNENYYEFEDIEPAAGRPTWLVEAADLLAEAGEHSADAFRKWTQ